MDKLLLSGNVNSGGLNQQNGLHRLLILSR